MLNFGTSAFLKLASLNDKPLRTELRKRLRPSRGGYDFHRSLRQLIYGELVDGDSEEEIAAAIARIARAPERKSAQLGIERLRKWRKGHPGDILAYNAVTYESPGGLFKVSFTPNFGLQIGEVGVAIHVWNTGRPKLRRETSRAVLSLFRPEYQLMSGAPGDLAVLSLPNSELHRLGDADAELGKGLIARFETTLREVIEELDRPTGDKHPPAPQP